MTLRVSYETLLSYMVRVMKLEPADFGYSLYDPISTLLVTF